MWPPHLTRWQATDVEPCIAVLSRHRFPVTSVSFTSDGVGLATIDDSGVLCYWDAYAGNLVTSAVAHFLSGSCVAFVPGDERGVKRGRITSSDSFAVTASRDKNAKLWDIRTCQLHRTFVGHDGCARGWGWSS